MALIDNAYSRFVAWLKILLPLAAIALLSMMFLFARTVDPTRSIPFADVDVEALARDPRVSGPTYAGVTRDGSAISLTADEVRGVAGETNSFLAQNVTARLADPGADVLEITAPVAQIDRGAGMARLTGGVSVESDAGYRLTSEGLRTGLRETFLESEGPIRAEAPFGTLEAGQMRAVSRDEAGGYVVDFTGGVKLVYQP